MTKIKAALDWHALSADYASYHTHPSNRFCHAIGIPLIMLAVVRWTQWPDVSLFPAVAVVLPLYAAWQPVLALGMAGVLFAMAAVAPHLNGWLVFGAFVLGWIFQFVGHGVYEGKSPAFTKNLLQILVGPMWVLGEHFPALSAQNSISEQERNML